MAIAGQATTDDSNIDVEIFDPLPQIKVEKVYDPAMLERLVPDHTYWLNRNISLEVLQKMRGGISPAGERSKLYNRYIFPIFRQDGKIIGWSGRLLADNPNSLAPKWKHLMKVSLVAYPLFISAPYIRKSREVILVESIGDCLSLFTAGIYNVIVVFGLNLNSKIMKYLLSESPERIIIATNNDQVGQKDNDEAGNRAAQRMRRTLLNLFLPQRLIVRLPPKKDFNEMTSEEIVQWHQKFQPET